MFLQSNTKSFDWHYEEEYRYEKIWHPEVASKENRFFTFQEDLSTK